MNSLPRVELALAQRSLAPGDIRSLVSLRVEQTLSAPSRCELVFEDPEDALAREATPPGTPLCVRVGDAHEPLFEGEVSQVERAYSSAGRVRLCLRAHDRLARLARRRPIRAHSDVTLPELVRQLTSDLEVTLGDVPASAHALRWPYVIQHRESDLELLVRLAQRAGLYLGLRGAALQLLSLAGDADTPAVELVRGANLYEAKFVVDAEVARRELVANGWDARSVRAHTARTQTAEIGRQVAASVLPADVGGLDEDWLVDLALGDAEQAQARAAAELARHAAAELVFRGVAQGQVQLRPGVQVRVREVLDAYAGTYVVTAAVHTLDPRTGYLTTLSSAPPAARGGEAMPAPSSLTLGVITRVDDPDAQGRVRARLAAFGDLETDWLHVLCLGGGERKGLMMLPDVGDSVLLLLAHGDPAQAVVLGAVRGADTWPDAGVIDGTVQRFCWRSNSGHHITLDDAARELRVSDATGSYLQLSQERVHIHSQVPLTLEAPGQALVIRAASIDFERG